MLQIGARGFEPFSHVRVPEDATSPIPGAGLFPAPVHALIEPESVQLPLVPHFVVNVAESHLSNLLLQLVPEAAGDGHTGLINRLPGGTHD